MSFAKRRTCYSTKEHCHKTEPPTQGVMHHLPLRTDPDLAFSAACPDSPDPNRAASVFRSFVSPLTLFTLF